MESTEDAVVIEGNISKYEIITLFFDYASVLYCTCDVLLAMEEDV